METLIGTFVVLFVLAPALVIGSATEQPVRTRVLWCLSAVLPVPVALVGWAVAISLLKPTGGIHSNYGAVAGVFAILGPWVVLWLFRRGGPGQMPPNSTPHADARPAQQLFQGPRSRAGGRER